MANKNAYERVELYTDIQQQERFDELEAETSESLAYFYCCIIFDLPFEIEAIPRDREKKRWLAYRDNLHQKKLDISNSGVPLYFLDGMTDIQKIFGGNIRTGEFYKIIGAEQTSRKREQGTKKQREIWGLGPKKQRYKTEDYNRLDSIFKTYSARLENSGGMDSQQEFILRECAKLTVEKEWQMEEGNIAQAQKLNKMILDNLGAESLLKKNARPVDDMRLDDFASKLEKAGLMRDGKWAPIPVILKKFFGEGAIQYPYTLDAAEQMILIMENRARVNNGLSELPTIEPDMRLHDDLGEFAKRPNAKEKEVYERLGLVKLPPEGKEHDQE